MSSFHLVSKNPWPFFMSIMMFNLMTSFTYYFKPQGFSLFFINCVISCFVMYCWFRDVVRESNGYHTKNVVSLLRLGMILLIISEIMFFFAFFWAFFSSSISPTFEVGCSWPPFGIQSLNPFQIPLLNTIVLLSSGVTMTLSHHSLLNGNYKMTWMSLLLTILLGFYFTSLQILEYYDAPFSMSDSVYGSTFFMMTGFHGFHVLVGSLFLAVIGLRVYFNHFSTKHHTGFECAIWYWHFVDVVWLFLYICIYWWGS